MARIHRFQEEENKNNKLNHPLQQSHGLYDHDDDEFDDDLDDEYDHDAIREITQTVLLPAMSAVTFTSIPEVEEDEDQEDEGRGGAGIFCKAAPPQPSSENRPNHDNKKKWQGSSPSHASNRGNPDHSHINSSETLVGGAGGSGGYDVVLSSPESSSGCPHNHHHAITMSGSQDTEKRSNTTKTMVATKSTGAATVPHRSATTIPRGFATRGAAASWQRTTPATTTIALPNGTDVPITTLMRLLIKGKTKHSIEVDGACSCVFWVRSYHLIQRGDLATRIPT